MAKVLVGALALASLPSAIAFRNTSPFFLFSTAESTIDRLDAQIAQSGQLTRDVIGSLKSCPSQAYLVVRQSGVSSSDYLDASDTPSLASLSGSKDMKSRMTIPDVVGDVDVDRIVDHLKSTCGAEVHKVEASYEARLPSSDGTSPQVIEFTAPSPAAKHRKSDLRSYDYAFNVLLDRVAESGDYTVIYTTTAQTEAQVEELEKQLTYEMEDPFGGEVQMELKRDTAAVHRRATKGKKTGGLFERYQYLSPGLFMGISASIPLFLILYFGLSSLASLEVSYFAFSKEMGPTAQRGKAQ